MNHKLREFFRLAAVWLNCRQCFDDEEPVFNMIGQMDMDAEMYRIIKEMKDESKVDNRQAYYKQLDEIDRELK